MAAFMIDDAVRILQYRKQCGVLINDVGGTPRRPMANNIVIRKQTNTTRKTAGSYEFEVVFHVPKSSFCCSNPTFWRQPVGDGGMTAEF